jgi:hypothetical protein
LEAIGGGRRYLFGGARAAARWTSRPLRPRERIKQMNTYIAKIRRNRTGDGDFAKGQYSCAHQRVFDNFV